MPSSARCSAARSQYSLTPRGRFVWGGYYEPGSLIWRSRWITEDGIVECREALALPTSRQRATILRQVHVLDGRRPARALAQPGRRLRPPRDGGAGPRRRRQLAGSARARSGCAGSAPRRPRWRGRGATASCGSTSRCAPASTATSCSSSSAARATGRSTRTELWRTTEESWRRRAPRLKASAAPRDAAQTCAVLSGLSGEQGGMVAAATCSLPERAEEGRNYDYRYVWIRDQSYAGQAGAAAGAVDLLDDAVRFIVARLLDDGPELMPAYTVDGAPVPREGELPVPGYPGGGHKFGNRVRDQFQLDAFGEALLLLAAAGDEDRLDGDGWRAAETAAAAIAERWREPDAGVWELAPARWAHSRLECAAGLRAIAAHAPGPGARRALVDAGRRAGRRRRRGLPASLRPLAARARRPAPRRLAADGGGARRGARRRPALAGDPGRGRGGALRRGLLLPLPGRRPAARRGRGRLPALRLLGRPRPRPARRDDDRDRLLRARPLGLRPTGPAGRGVRRPASASCAATCRRPSSTR